MRACILFILLTITCIAQPRWEAVRVALGSVESVALSPVTGPPHHVVFAAATRGLYRSTDLGESWHPLDHASLGVDVRAVTVIGRAVFALCDDGIRRSTDAGDTWIRLMTKRATNSIASFGRTPEDLQHLVVGTIDGILFSNDSGRTWEARNNGFRVNRWQSNYQHVSAHRPSHDTSQVVIFANGWEDVYETRDTGRTWRPALQRNVGAFDMLIADEAAGLLMTAGSHGIRSMRHGDTSWLTLSTSYHRSLALSSGPHGRVLFAGTDSIGFLVSTDDGTHWSARSTALSRRSVHAFAIDPTNGTLLFAGTDSGCFRSTDAGETWRPVNNGLQTSAVYRLTITRAHDGMASLFASTENGTWVSHDCAATWKPTSAPPDDAECCTTTVECTTQSGGTIIFTGTETGVRCSRDAGATWSALGGGMPPARVTQLHIVRSAECTYLLAVSRFQLWKLPLADLLVK